MSYQIVFSFKSSFLPLLLHRNMNRWTLNINKKSGNICYFSTNQLQQAAIGGGMIKVHNFDLNCET
jgi:hypothetical protein